MERIDGGHPSNSTVMSVELSSSSLSASFTWFFSPFLFLCSSPLPSCFGLSSFPIFCFDLLVVRLLFLLPSPHSHTHPFNAVWPDSSHPSPLSSPSSLFIPHFPPHCSHSSLHFHLYLSLLRTHLHLSIIHVVRMQSAEKVVAFSFIPIHFTHIHI